MRLFDMTVSLSIETRPALTPARSRVLDLPTPEGWKAELN